PELVRGDFVELLPEMLDRRRDGALTVVFQTAALSYVPADGRERVYAALARAGEDAPVALVSTSRPREGVHTYWGVWLQTWPAGERELLAHADFHGAWIEWAPS